MKKINAYLALPIALTNPDSTVYNPSNNIITHK